MAPEMYEENYDESVDVYAFGMCLLEMCTLEYPYMECKNPAQIYKKVTSGTPPLSLEKVKDPEIRTIIDICTAVEKEKRYMVKDLLQHESFFAEETSMTVELLTQSEDSPDKLLIRMRVHDQVKKNGEEAIEFPYDLKMDKVEEVVEEMVKSGILRNDYQKNASRTIKETVDTALSKRKEKDKERLLSQASSQSENNAGEGDGGQGMHTKPQKQLFSAADVSADPKDRPHTPAPPRSDCTIKQPEPPSSASSKTQKEAPPSSTSISVSVGPFSAPSSQCAAPLISSAVVAPEIPGLVREPPGGGPAGSEVVGGDDRKLKDPQVFKEPTKPPAVSESVSSRPLDPVSQLSSASHSHLEVGGVSSLSFHVHTPVPTAGMGWGLGDSAAPVLVQRIASSAGEEGGRTEEGHQGGNGGPKKKQLQRKKKMKLSLLSVTEGNVAKCQLLTAAGQQIHFQFSMDYDKPREIFMKIVQAKHLQITDENDFIQQLESEKFMHKRGDHPPDTKPEPQGTTSRPEGTISRSEGTTSRSEGTTTIPEGPTSRPEGTTSSPEGTTSKQEVVKQVMNAAEITSNKASLPGKPAEDDVTSAKSDVGKGATKSVKVSKDEVKDSASSSSTAVLVSPAQGKGEGEKEKPAEQTEGTLRCAARDSPSAPTQSVEAVSHGNGSDEGQRFADLPPHPGALSSQTSSESTASSTPLASTPIHNPNPPLPLALPAQGDPTKYIILTTASSSSSSIVPQSSSASLPQQHSSASLPPQHSSSSSSVLSSNVTNLSSCAIADPTCSLSLPTTATTSTLNSTIVPSSSSHRTFEVADVNESDSPDDLSAHGSLENLEQEEGGTTAMLPQDTKPASCHDTIPSLEPLHGNSETNIEGIEFTVGNLGPDYSPGEDARGPSSAQSAPPCQVTFITHQDSKAPQDFVAPRSRSTSLPQGFSGPQHLFPDQLLSTASSVSASLAMPPIPEQPQKLPQAPVGAESVYVTHSYSGTYQRPPSQLQVLSGSQSANTFTSTSFPFPLPHHHPPTTSSEPPPHPSSHPHPSYPLPFHSKLSHPHPGPSNPLDSLSQHQSEILINAFTHFLVAMQQLVSDPAIQPFLHSLKEHRTDERPAQGCVASATPTSPTYTASHKAARVDRHMPPLSTEVHIPHSGTDLELQRQIKQMEEIEKEERVLQERKKRIQMEIEKQRRIQRRESATTTSHHTTRATSAERGVQVTAKGEARARGGGGGSSGGGAGAGKREVSRGGAGERGGGGGWVGGVGGEGATQHPPIVAQRDIMERRVTEDLFNSVPQSVPPSTSTTAAFYNSYHGESAGQLRHLVRMPVAQIWDVQRYNTTAVPPSHPARATTSAYAYVQRPQMSVSPPPYTTVPHSTPTPPPPPPSSHLPTYTSPPLTRQPLQQKESEEWTEYASASSEAVIKRDSTSPTGQGQSEKPDVSEFDPINYST